MKLAQKMILVPTGRPDPELASLSNLDQAMSNVLHNKNLTNVETVNLYQQILRKNLTVDAKLKQKSHNPIVSKPIDSENTIRSEAVEEISELEDINPMETSGLNRMDIEGILEVKKI